MKNIPQSFLRQHNPALAEKPPCRFFVPGADSKECRQVFHTMLEEALLGVVADADHIPPRYRVHWVEDPVQWLFRLFDNFLQRLRVGESRVCFVGGVKEFFVYVLQGVAFHAGADFSNVEQRIEEEEGHCRE